MGSKVHRVRFYTPFPKSINSASYNKKHKLLAIVRDDASIEVWDLNRAPCLIRFIPSESQESVEALGWVGERLLSTGLNGALIEWDIIKLTRKNSILLTGYAAWCLDVNEDETLVAVGTEQGFVNLFSVESNDIVYNKLFDKQDGRIMCCKFDKTGKMLVTGSTDTIRVWNVDTGHAITRISVTRRKKEVLVWCVAVLSDNTIVSGDSQGRLTFWDGTLGEQIESYTVQKADILSIGVSEDETELYCSGVDPIINHFKKVDKKPDGKQAGGKWVKNVQRHIHEHDVRTLIVADRRLVSVGKDGYLTLSSYPPKWVMRIPPMIPSPRTSVSAKKKLLLLRYNNHLEVWKLGSYSGNILSNNTSLAAIQQEKNNKLEQDSAIIEVNKLAHNGEDKNKSLQITENPSKLVSVQTKKKKQIQCCALSPNGEFIVYATNTDVRMLKLAIDDAEDQNDVSLSKILITGMSATCDRVAFSEDSQTMVAHSDGTLYILHVDPDAGATVIQTLTGEKVLKTTSLLHLLVSGRTRSGGVYVVAADARGVVEVYGERKGRFAPHASLPRRRAVPTALTVDALLETLIVVYSDQAIVEYSLSTKTVSGWPGARLPEQWCARAGPALGAAVHPRTRALVCHDDTSLWVLDRTKQDQIAEPAAKKRHNASPINFSVIPIKYLAGFHWLESDEAVLVELLPESIVSQLPAPVQTNRWS